MAKTKRGKNKSKRKEIRTRNSNSKSLSIKTQFNEAKNYLKETKNYIYAIIALFFICAILGFVFKENLTFLNDMLKDLIRETENLGTWETIFFILQNNLQSALIACVSGIFLGIVPLTNAILNGLVLGYVAALSTEVAGFGILWRLLPHGIFELPAIFIALGLGIKLGFSIFNPVKFKSNFYNSANTFLMIVIPLLILAAFIEGILIGFLS